MTEFKIGEWVRVKLTSKIFKITSEKDCIDQYEDRSSCWDFNNGYNKYHSVDLEQWQPQAREWCWFRSPIMPSYLGVLAQFKELNTTNDFAMKYTIMFNADGQENGVTSIHYSECEPFTSKLPSFTKE